MNQEQGFKTEARTYREILADYLDNRYVHGLALAFILLNLMVTVSYYTHEYVTTVWFMEEVASETNDWLVGIDGIFWFSLLLLVVWDYLR